MPGSRMSEGNKKEDQLGDKLRDKLGDKRGTGRQKLGDKGDKGDKASARLTHHPTTRRQTSWETS